MLRNPHQLLLIFIHGFKGDDQTFQDFPVRLATTMGNQPNLTAKSIVYKKYETRGHLAQAVDAFCLWLDTEVKAHEEEKIQIDGENVFAPVWVCLFGHSMGGIIAADAVLKYRRLGAENSPKIIGLLAYDTPYYGLEYDMMNTVYTRATEYKNQIENTVSMVTAGAVLAQSFWGGKNKEETKSSTSETKTAKPSNGFGVLKWGAAALAVGAVGTMTYRHKEKVGAGMDWVSSHLEFVSALIRKDELKKRLDELMQDPDIIFHCYYTLIPPRVFGGTSKTFIALPPNHMRKYFSPYECDVDSEIDAHTTMFDPKTNHNYYTLAEMTSRQLLKILEKFE
ncbi:596_t:CDS:2 [Ambispora gerdemannii]|uniref:596_t:CDS:1 n=1 Tax=Ambispora gerdemannii TaxID=144530 RepID=A0A9N8Z2R3_9GLOM|nr:596_t:CDS:2 [Ambispora gerdemannii]